MSIERILFIGSLVHDLSSIIGGARAYVHLTQIKHESLLNENESLASNIEKISERLEVAANFLNTLGMSVVPSDSAEPMNPNEVIRLALDKVEIPKGIDVKWEREPMKNFLATPAIIEVVRNLISNAIDAMPSGGTITISTDIDRSSDSVSITVTDTGTGIPESIKRMLFREIVSTKKYGFGLGLLWSGLYLEQLGGKIDIQSKEEEGTLITIHLPEENQNR